MARNKKSIKNLFLVFFLGIIFLCWGSILPILAQCDVDVCQGGCTPAALCYGCSGCSGGGGGGSSGGSGSQPLGTFKGLGPLGSFINPSDNPGPAILTFTKIISNAVGVMTIIAVIWFLFTLFLGAIGWLGSGGDKQKLQNAQKQITTGLVGFLIVIAAIFLIKVIGIIFGVDFLDLYNQIIKLWQ